MKSSGRPPRSATPPIEQSAWAWVEAIQDPETEVGRPEILSAYKLNFPAHIFHEAKCKKNCKSNPRCYIGLGEHRWLERKKTGNDKTEEEFEPDVTSEHRLLNTPAGLINLGNTCYVNSFLQIWFHNVWLREAVYTWNPVEDHEECENETLIEGQTFQPKGKIGSLQALFALMEFSQRKALDPNDFISKLGLDPQVQQDAQEFSKLFMSLLESSLAHQTNPKVKTIVQNQFCGEYAYITTCSKCKRESKRPSDFYELVLTLQGKKTLTDCLQDYLGNEVLDGDNKYFCEACDAKRDATRCVRLTKLPPVLNLSLNRFIFDMKTGTRKKLNSPVSFPQELDMSVYVGQEPGTSVYNLTGVLIHIGDDAHQGHYKAHIQELSTGHWFQFSDDVVESLEGMESQLGSQVDVEPGATAKPTKKSKSKNPGSTCAYMFVYTARTALDELKRKMSEKIADGKDVVCNGNKNGKGSKKAIKNGDVGKTESTETPPLKSSVMFPDCFPAHLKSFIEEDLAERKSEIEKLEAEQVSASEERKIIGNLMLKVCSKLSFEDGSSEFEFLPTDWIKAYFANPQSAPQINTDQLLCFHGKLDIEKLSSVKAISSEVSSLLLDRIGGINRGIRLASDLLCDQCVINRSRQMKLSQSIAGDTKLVQDLLKETVDESPDVINYWAGKNSLKRWRAIAKEELHDKIVSESDQFTSDHPEPFSEREKLETLVEEDESEVVTKDRFDEVKSKLSSRGTTIVATSSLKQNGIDRNNVTVTNDDVDTNDANLEPDTSSKRSNRRLRAEGGITVSNKWTTMVISNSSEITQDFVQSMQNLSKPESEQRCRLQSQSSDAAKDEEVNGDSTSQRRKSESTEMQNDSSTNRDVQFNADIVCQHGNLCIDVGRRRLVTSKVWAVLKKYFPKCKEFNSQEEPCGDCENELDQVKSESKLKQEFAQQQKSALPDIFGERNRPSWAKHNLNKVYLISRSFVNSWRHWLRNPSNSEPLETLGNEMLLCEHRQLLYPLDLDTESDYKSVVYMVTEDEWLLLINYYEVDQEIFVTRNRYLVTNGSDPAVVNNGSATDDESLLISSPPVCRECVERRRQQELDERLAYKDAIVYVRRLNEREKPPDDDPDFDDVTPEDPSSSKRIKLGNGKSNTASTSSGSAQSSDFVRRSNRSKRVRGAKEFHVSSDMLLRDLKVKIMRSFSVAPYDQNLCLNGKYLTDSMMTLSQLKVLPLSTIYLTVDEPNSGATAEPECWPVQDTEEGFKGTGLVGSSK